MEPCGRFQAAASFLQSLASRSLTLRLLKASSSAPTFCRASGRDRDRDCVRRGYVRDLHIYRQSFSLHHEGKEVPWKRNKPTMLLTRPAEPTMTISFGLVTSAILCQSLRHELQAAVKQRTWHSDEPVDGLESDRETKCEQEDAVDERTEDFGPLPAI